MDYKIELEKLKEAFLYREIKKIEKLEGKYIFFEGKKYLDFSSSNYLGLRDDRRIIEIMKKALDEYGVGSGASRLVVGTAKVFEELEEYLAKLKNKDKALFFNSGYDLNLGVISAIANKGTYVFCDKLNHASIYDGISLSKSNLIRYKHNDIKDLERNLEKYKGVEDKLLVTDTVFSMDGDKAKLKEIVKLKDKYGFRIMVDEAHAGGVLGENGMGLVEAENLYERIDIIMGTFSKAYGGQGAYVVGDKDFIEYLINKTRSLIYTTSLPPSIVAGNLEALKISINEKFRKETLKENSEYLRETLNKEGFFIGESETQIIPVIFDSNEEALFYYEELLKKGIYLPAIRKPTVMKARLRISLGYKIEKIDIDYLINALVEIKNTLN
ncbi:MAG: pyridoxal phosphate-dependent aminotransferase family protein [Fusobacteriaceae bacterium]|nr:pyridoxal phosphate-dependent aminotransferase family protein [Fusobacteriaceae bacterium]MBN2837536.1 pyridoxal phosphate-dependent aminotransferase family protein [Fusobacteriaceae bacterium]